MQTLAGVPADGNIHTTLHNIGNPKWHRAATAAEQERLIGSLESELADGALGVGILLGYAPGTEPGEYLAIAAAAAQAGRPVFTHARELVEADSTVPVDGPTEIVRAAAETGAHMHYCHINSTSRRHIDRVLALVDKCRHEGGHITTEAYPYGSGSTAIGATFLDPDLLSRWELTPSSIIYLPTGERIADAARLRELRALDPGALVVVELLRESDPRDRALLAASMLHSDTIIASDAMPVMRADGTLGDDTSWPLPSGSVTHPRTAGTFAKTLRTYVRDQATMDVVEVIRRAATLPALLLERISPDMRRKGRLQTGADADIVAFDPATVSDQATYEDSCRISAGFRHVLVNGVPVIKGGHLDLEAMPGRPIRAG